jgi:hypothetical protein
VGRWRRTRKKRQGCKIPDDCTTVVMRLRGEPEQSSREVGGSVQGRRCRPRRHGGLAGACVWCACPSLSLYSLCKQMGSPYVAQAALELWAQGFLLSAGTTGQRPSSSVSSVNDRTVRSYRERRDARCGGRGEEPGAGGSRL